MGRFICPHGNPVNPAASFTPDQCRICWLAAKGMVTVPDVSVQVEVQPIGPCVHQGKIVRHAGCNCPRKDTYACLAGKGDVTPVRHCGPGLCDRYELDVL